MEKSIPNPDKHLRWTKTFCENSERLKAVDYFRKNAPSFEWILNTSRTDYQSFFEEFTTDLETLKGFFFILRIRIIEKRLKARFF